MPVEPINVYVRFSSSFHGRVAFLARQLQGQRPRTDDMNAMLDDLVRAGAIRDYELLAQLRQNQSRRASAAMASVDDACREATKAQKDFLIVCKGLS